METKLLNHSHFKALRSSLTAKLSSFNFKSEKLNFLVNKTTVLATAFVLASSFFNQAQAQCTSVVYATPSNNCGLDQIINVTFQTINRTSACDVFTVYTAPTPTVQAGQTYSISVTTGADVEGISAWIDFNNDGVFSNVNERILGPAYLATNPATYTANVFIPVTAVTGPTRLRVRCNFLGAPVDATSAQTWGETEDYCINILPAPPCVGVPSANSVIAPTTQSICPNSTINLALANSYTNSGITYQWQASSLGLAGTFSAIPGATTTIFATPNLTVNTYFNAVVSCALAGGGNFTTAVNQVLVSAIITSSVPYFESFETIAFNNSLPNCSWVASNLIEQFTLLVLPRS